MVVSSAIQPVPPPGFFGAEKGEIPERLQARPINEQINLPVGLTAIEHSRVDGAP